MPNITRALDELGRFVIPKEMRDNMKLRAGDQLEIVCTDNGLLIRKYMTTPLLDVIQELRTIIDQSDDLTPEKKAAVQRLIDGILMECAS